MLRPGIFITKMPSGATELGNSDSSNPVTVRNAGATNPPALNVKMTHVSGLFRVPSKTYLTVSSVENISSGFTHPKGRYPFDFSTIPNKSRAPEEQFDILICAVKHPILKCKAHTMRWAVNRIQPLCIFSQLFCEKLSPSVEARVCDPRFSVLHVLSNIPQSWIKNLLRPKISKPPFSFPLRELVLHQCNDEQRHFDVLYYVFLGYNALKSGLETGHVLTSGTNGCLCIFVDFFRHIV